MGNEALENWLLKLLTPKIDFSFHILEREGTRSVLLEIPRANHSPVQFKGTEFIRVGSYTKKLREHPERERNLWRVFEKTPFESLSARENVSEEEVVRLLDYPSYFDLMGLDLPTNRDRIIERLEKELFIARTDSGSWNILNLAALLFAKELSSFPALSRKALRVIHYRGENRIETLHEQVGNRGYANGFEGLVGFINARLPHNEVLGTALRKDVLEDFTDEMIDLFQVLKVEKDSFNELGIDIEEKAFYDILKSLAIKYDFDYPEDKLLELAKKVKTVVDDKAKYTDWSQRADIKAELKVSLIILLANNDYPPVDRDEVYKEIFEQAENFKKYRGA